MQKIQLGRSGIAVPPVIFGCNIFGWTVDKAQSFKLLDALVDAGLNALDTADGAVAQSFDFAVSTGTGANPHELIAHHVEVPNNRLHLIG